MQVVIRQPEIERDTVTWHWTPSELHPLQRIDGFSFRYENVDLTQFTDDLFYEIFLALQLKIFAALKRPVTLVFPSPVCASSIAFWKAYHKADLVSIEPAGGPATYSPWRSSAPVSSASGPHAVFFGGGKDSMLAAALLGELEGADNVLLIQYVTPLRPNHALATRLERRQQQLMLRPAQEQLGFAAQRVWTDYQANFQIGADRIRPHLELYTAGALPAMLARGVVSCAFGTPRTTYAIARRADGTPRFHYGNSRPEVLATQSKHYQRVLGGNLTVSCFSMLLTTLMAQGLLALRYPAASRHAISCTLGAVDEPWCYQCKKCSDYALFGLHFGQVDDRFDYDRFYRESAFIAGILRYASSGVQPARFGNAPWTQAWCTPLQYGVNGHTLARLDLGLLTGLIGLEAKRNLGTLISLFGNREFPYAIQLARSSIDFVGTNRARAVAAIAENYFETVEDLVGPFPYGNDEVDYDFRTPMPARTALLEHIRS